MFGMFHINGLTPVRILLLSLSVHANGYIERIYAEDSSIHFCSRTQFEDIVQDNLSDRERFLPV